MTSKAKKDTFKKGDRVSARWSGSNVYYDAKVLDVAARTYKVQFDDGSVSSLKFSDVKVLQILDSSTEPSPKTSKSKSRSRSRSTERRITRSRSKSPARKKRVPPKQERKTGTKETKKKEAEDAPNSNSVPKRDEADSKLSDLAREKIASFKEIIRRSPVVVLNSNRKEIATAVEKLEGVTERPKSSRLAALRAAELTRESLSKTQKPTEVDNAKPSEKKKYSDDEEEEEEDEVDAPPMKLSITMKIVYFFVTLYRIALLPTTMLICVYACTKKQCTILDVPHFYSRWRDVVNSVMYPMLGISAYHLLHCLLALVPVGNKVMGFSFETQKTAMEYRLNGFLILIVNILIFGLCAYFGVNMNWGFDKFRGIALSCALYSILWAIGLHVYAAVKGDSTTQTKIPVLGKFYNGSYINPLFFGKIDLKTSFIRAGLMGSVLLNMSILMKYVMMKGFITVPLAVAAGLQIFFVLETFYREERLLSTATYSSDTVGYSFLFTTGCLIPIGLTFPNVYLFLYETSRPHENYYPAGFVFLFFVGYVIYMYANKLKHEFRRNPFSPSLADVTSIPTSRKKRLIVSSLWGVVRHPNYVGLFIMATAWTLPCGFTHVLPYGPLLLLTISMVIRCLRIEAECKEKYGPAWKNYCERVRSRMIPFVF